MSNYPRLDETGLNTLTEALADATKQQGVIKVCETEAEWNQKSQAEKDDANTYWFLPWKTETSGEIDDSTTALDKVWSSQKVNSENTALKAMVTDDYVFSPTKSYAAGDWLIHNNILYEVLVACTGVTPPNATYYAVKNLHDLKSEIDALKSDVSALEDTHYVSHTNLSGFTAGSYVNERKIGRLLIISFYLSNTTARTGTIDTWTELCTLNYSAYTTVDTFIDNANSTPVAIQVTGNKFSFQPMKNWAVGTFIRGIVVCFT